MRVPDRQYAIRVNIERDGGNDPPNKEYAGVRSKRTVDRECMLLSEPFMPRWVRPRSDKDWFQGNSEQARSGNEACTRPMRLS